MRVAIDYSQRDFKSQARTLCPSALGFNEKSGWTVTGEVCEDYYEWVNEFEATHPIFGWVRGDFETEVAASSKLAWKEFSKHYQPEEWDYWDI